MHVVYVVAFAQCGLAAMKYYLCQYHTFCHNNERQQQPQTRHSDCSVRVKACGVPQCCTHACAPLRVAAAYTRHCCTLDTAVLQQRWFDTLLPNVSAP
eukprot:16994-Heterococcus_DN1.PRE.5